MRNDLDGDDDDADVAVADDDGDCDERRVCYCGVDQVHEVLGR